MAQTSEAVSVISIRGQSVGLDKLASDVRSVDEAQKDVAASSEKLEQRTLSVERAYNRLQSRYDQAYRTQQDLERATRTLDQAQEQGLVTDQRRGEILGIVAKRANDAAEAFAKIQRSLGPDAATAAQAKALEDLRAKFNPLFAAGRQYKDTLTEIREAAKLGALSEAEQVAAIARTKEAFAAQVVALKGATSANDNLKKSHAGLSAEAQAAGHSVRSFIDSVISGQSPTTALAQQVGNLQFAAGGRGGLSGALTEVSSTLGKLVTPATVAGTSLVGAATLAFRAWSRYDDLQRQVLGTLQGVGRQVGLTTAQFLALGQRAGEAGGLSAARATDVANTLARTGQLSASNIERITVLTKAFAATFTGGDLAQAQQMMGDLFKEPEEGIKRLLRDLPGVTLQEQRQVDLLIKAGDRQGAVAAGIEIAARNMANYNDTVSKSTGAWEKIKSLVSDIDLGMGAAIDKVASIGDRLSHINVQNFAGAFGGAEPNLAPRPAVPAVPRAVTTGQAFGPAVPTDAQTQILIGHAAQLERERAGSVDADLKFNADQAKQYANELGLVNQKSQDYIAISKLLDQVRSSGNEQLKEQMRQLGLTGQSAEAYRDSAEKLLDAEEKRRRERELDLEAEKAEGPVAQARIAAQRAELATSDQVITNRERQAIANQQVSLGLIRQQNILRDLNRDAAMQRETLELETRALGMTDAERAVAVAQLQAEQTLRRQLIPLTEEGSKKYIEQSKANALANAELQKQRQLWSGIESAASSALGSLAHDLSSGVKPAEALTRAIGGIGDSLTKIGTDSLSKSLTSGLQGMLKGGGMAGFAFDPVSLGVGAAGAVISAGVSYFQGQQQKRADQRQKNIDAWQKAQEDELAAIQKHQQAVIDAGIASAKASQEAAEEATRRAEAATRRIESFSDRATMAGLDTTTLGGQLAALNLQQQREREQEVRDGGEALVALEAAQFAERERLLRDFTDKAILEEKRRFDEAKAFLDQFARTIQAFISGLQTGAQSPLSPADRLAAAQSQFSTQLSLAQGGDRDALNAITGNASTLLDAAKAFYASSQGFQDIYNTVVGQLGALPTQVSAEQLIVDAIDNQTQSLSDILNQLDTNGDGMISRQEAANTWLATIFNELDVNGDGQISRLELIRFATAGTETNVASTTASVDVTNSILSTQQALLSAVSANTNATVAGIQNDITQAGTLGTYTQKIVFNTASIASHEGAPAQFAVGGWVNGPGSGMSDSIRAMLSAGEFVVKADAAQSYGPMLEAMNAGRTLPAVPVANDNSGLFAALLGEVRTLTGRVGQLEASLVRATLGGAEHVREGVDNVAASHRDLVRETKKRAA
jgi:hypothetical protein